MLTSSCANVIRVSLCWVQAISASRVPETGGAQFCQLRVPSGRGEFSPFSPQTPLGKARAQSLQLQVREGQTRSFQAPGTLGTSESLVTSPLCPRETGGRMGFSSQVPLGQAKTQPFSSSYPWGWWSLVTSAPKYPWNWQAPGAW